MITTNEKDFEIVIKEDCPGTTITIVVDDDPLTRIYSIGKNHIQLSIGKTEAKELGTALIELASLFGKGIF